MQTETASLQLKLKNLPTSPGVYQYKDREGKVIYVGKAKNLRSRVQSYFRELSDHSHKTRLLVSKIADLELILTGSEVEALILENNLIKQLKPRYNINLRDDKTYPYIVITNERFPRIFPTRTVRRDGSKYFGPYTESRQMRFLLDAISEIFQVRSCDLKLSKENVEAKKFKVCLDYHIKKCMGPCEGLQAEEDYNLMVAEIRKLLGGKTKDVLRSIEVRMKNYAKDLKFEQAALLRRQYEAMERYSSKQKVLSTDDIDRDIFSIARDADDACGVAFKVRGGKLLGSQHYYFSNTLEVSGGEMLSKFLEKFYLETDFIPDEIFVGETPSEHEAIEALIQKRSMEFNEPKRTEIIVPQIGDKAKLLKMCGDNAQHLLSEYLIQKEKRGEALAIPQSVRSLERDLRLPKMPRRIECFDNSNFQGTDPVASMVCFTDGKPRKSDYRKFKIKTVVGSDDFASMAEVIERRYAGSLSSELPMPDLIVVDGGKGQLSSAHDVLQRLGITTPVIGLAKKLEEVFFPMEQFAHNLPKTSSSLKLLQQVRDEAHRFAITFHREVRSKRTLQTELTQIDGVGKGKAEKLLKTFGSVAQVEAASLAALTEAVGAKTAAVVRRYFDQSRNEVAQDGEAMRELHINEESKPESGEEHQPEANSSEANTDE
ncbi:MAG: excinuclease ABC subunit C [Rhizobacter sp.]|nr:excinuclease ABC subunit C [Chlorobiales bacterium]